MIDNAKVIVILKPSCSLPLFSPMNIRYLILACSLLSLRCLIYANTVSAQTLSFADSHSEVTTGEQQTATIVLDPGTADIGSVDVVMRYEPVYLDILNVSRTATFKMDLEPVIDRNDGEVRFSLSTNPGEAIPGKTEISSITYTGQREIVRTALTFEFILGKSTDTNVISNRGKDVLKNVGSLILTIQNPPLIPVVNAQEVRSMQKVLPPEVIEAFEVVSPLPQNELVNPNFRVVEQLDEAPVGINDLNFVLLIVGVFGLVGIAVFLHRVRRMFFTEETTLFANTSQLDPQV